MYVDGPKKYRQKFKFSICSKATKSILQRVHQIPMLGLLEIILKCCAECNGAPSVTNGGVGGGGGGDMLSFKDGIDPDTAFLSKLCPLPGVTTLGLCYLVQLVFELCFPWLR